MSLNIFIAHTGVCLNADPILFTSIDSLKSWIARHAPLKASGLILMTARGKQVKLQTLLTEKAIFAYDRELLSVQPNASSRSKSLETYSSAPFVVNDPPETLGQESNLEAWQKLFKNRRAWAIDLSRTCEGLLRDAERYDAETIVIQRATAIAVENVKQHVGGLHQKFEEASNWASGALGEHKTLLSGWETSLERLSSIPAKSELKRFLRTTRQIPRRDGHDAEPTLQDFVDIETLRRAASTSTGGSQRLSHRLAELTTAYDAAMQDGSTLVDSFNHAFETSNLDVSETANGLIEEIEAIVKKISADYENNLSLPAGPKSVAAISKTALLHSRNFLPTLTEAAAETDQLLQKAVERKTDVTQSALSYLQRISMVESALAGIQPGLAALDIGADDGEALDAIGFPQQLPYVYGSLLIEIARRREWDEKMKTDSFTLAEEMGIHKEEEEKRRKKWLKTVDNHLIPDTLDSRVMGMEVNLKPLEHQWPRVSRDDIGEYLSSLSGLEGLEATLSELRELFKGLDAQTRQQARRGNAFRNGSVHDAAYGRNSLLLRGDDDLLRSLQSDKSKLEDRLKGSESRIRKLEDLLHRQTQIPKPTGASIGITNAPVLERLPTSPVLNHAPSSPRAQDSMSRHTSVSSRRFSANLGAEEKTLTQRIVKLEAELTSEKAKTTQLQAASVDHTHVQNGLRNEVREAISTKKDLLDNFEAQQHEFDGEKRLLGEENTKLKLRLEELEEELDRILGSHENARAGLDERTRNLDMELERVKKEAAEEVEKAQGRINFFKSDYTMQREQAYKLERHLQQLEEEKKFLSVENLHLKEQIRMRDNQQEDNLCALQATHAQLSAGETAPNNFNSLVEAIEILAERSDNHLHELKQTVETMKADNAVMEARFKSRDLEAVALGTQLASEEKEALSLREDIAQEKAHTETLQKELEDERKELQRLRTKFVAGETGSAVLRSKVAVEERKVQELSTSLKSANTHSKQLESEIAEKASHIESLEDSCSALNSRLEFRARRAAELSTMLFSHTDRLSCLLEHIGFTVTKQDDGMMIQKAPRAVSASTALIDQSQSMNRSMSAPLPAKSAEPPPGYLRWAMADDQITEMQSYDIFLREIQTFDMDSFTEAVIRRVKETEHTARKWQREAKAYREKSHRAQLEAHEKIAYRSFKEGDLALFLPTRNQATRPWAAFNVGAPHYFLREQDSHRLRTRDWLLARISKVEERVVDLSKSITGLRPPNKRRRNSITSDGGASFDDENPFELSDGLRWYMLDAAEEKPGAPTTPGLGKSTVASANVDARGSIQRKKTSDESRATKTLTKSLDSRRSSSGSKKSLVGATSSLPPGSASAAIPERAAQAQSPVRDGGASLRTEAQSPSRPDSASMAKQLDPDDGARSRAVSPLKESESASASPAKSSGGRLSPQKPPEKPKARAWEGLWSLDLSLEGVGRGKK